MRNVTNITLLIFPVKEWLQKQLDAIVSTLRPLILTKKIGLTTPEYYIIYNRRRVLSVTVKHGYKTRGSIQI